MRILQAHKYYWPRDGASNYMLALSRELEKHDHDVVPFATLQDETVDTPYKKYFVEYIDLASGGKRSMMQTIKGAAHLFYSREAAKNLDELLTKHPVDVAHLHNIYHHISPSILPVLKKHGVKIVMTLHDYKLLSPNYSLFHHGRIQEDDARGLHLSCIKNKCMKDSFAKSALGTVAFIWHHKIKKYHERYIDKFIAPSQFMMDLCIKHGWPKDKFVHINHPIFTTSSQSKKKGDSDVVYMGRLSEEKGLDVLLDAAKIASDTPFRLIGTGPMEGHLKDRVKEEKLTNVTFSGFLTGDPLVDALSAARLLVLPSIWYENYPLSVLEAKAAGKVVIGSNIGGIPELLQSDLLARPGDARDLAIKIKQWYDAPLDKRRKRGIRHQQDVIKHNNLTNHISRIEALYRSL